MEGWTLCGSPLSWGGTNTKLRFGPSCSSPVQLLVKQSISKQPTSFLETCKLQTVSSLPLANTNLMYIFGPRHLASQTQFSAIDADIVVWPRTVDGGACGPRAMAAGEVVWDFARCRVHAPGECAWAGVTGGYAQINNSGADFVQRQVVFFVPTSDFRRDTRLVVLDQLGRPLVRCPSLNRSRIAPWSVASFGLDDKPPLWPDRPRPRRRTLRVSSLNPSARVGRR